MFGHHESAQATVLYTQDVTGQWEDRLHSKIEFVLEVRTATGQAFRAKATHHFIMFTDYPQVGDVINVKYNPKSLEVQLDVNDDNRYGEKGLKRKQDVEREAAQAQRDALLAAPPGTPLSSSASAGGAGMAGVDPVILENLRQAQLLEQRVNAGNAGMAHLDPKLLEARRLVEEAKRRLEQPASFTPAGGAGMAGLDPELQELMRLEEAERQAAQDAQTPAGFPGMASPGNPQAATGPVEMQMLRQELEYAGTSGQAKILRKQQAGAPVQHLTPFFVEVLVQPDAQGFPFQCSFTTWIDTSKGMLMEGYTLPVKYDPQNTARVVFLFPA